MKKSSIVNLWTKIPLNADEDQEKVPEEGGYMVKAPPLSSNDHLEEIAILIGNKKKEKFRLVIDRIELR